MQLPAGARVWASAGTDSAWTLGEHLTASVFDALQIGNWQRSGDSKAPRPKPMQRPSDARESSLRADRMEAKAHAFLARQRAREAAQNDQPRQRARDARGRFTKEA